MPTAEDHGYLVRPAADESSYELYNRHSKQSFPVVRHGATYYIDSLLDNSDRARARVGAQSGLGPVPGLGPYGPLWAHRALMGPYGPDFAQKIMNFDKKS